MKKMLSDLQRTIHYTTKAQEICANLVKYIPTNANLIEPFVGDGDLLSLFPNHSWECYDIEEKEKAIQQDTLLNPPNYLGRWVITNPPYLAKNKAKNKTIFNKYSTDDLYKATLLSLLDCEGGILIIPTNFFTDERTKDIRIAFLSNFTILEANIFTRPVFETTTYSVCSFAFQRITNQEKQTFSINIYPENKQEKITLCKDFGYRLAGEFYNNLENTTIMFGRLVGSTSPDFITHIKLFALDTRNERIRVEYTNTPYEGKDSDRVYATLTCKRALTKEQENILIKEFNKQLEEFRLKYYDLSMTNYRDYNRKRIGFTFAYQLMSKIYYELFE